MCCIEARYCNLGDKGTGTAVFTTSRRGYPIIRLGEHIFGEHSANKVRKGPKKRWVCNKTRKGCRSFLITIGQHIVNYRNEHNH
ncbi:FLYWCH zinc finger domain-containing protein [Phthorimaea operculella]|nr:FLYWCH zinc finger domain-containing protein [Phthorimaea operculella]